MTRTNDELQREVAALIKQSADLKAFARELAKTADELRDKFEKLQVVIRKSRGLKAR